MATSKQRNESASRDRRSIQSHGRETERARSRGASSSRDQNYREEDAGSRSSTHRRGSARSEGRSAEERSQRSAPRNLRHSSEEDYSERRGRGNRWEEEEENPRRERARGRSSSRHEDDEGDWGDTLRSAGRRVKEFFTPEDEERQERRGGQGRGRRSRQDEEESFGSRVKEFFTGDDDDDQDEESSRSRKKGRRARDDEEESFGNRVKEFFTGDDEDDRERESSRSRGRGRRGRDEDHYPAHRKESSWFSWPHAKNFLESIQKEVTNATDAFSQWYTVDRFEDATIYPFLDIVEDDRTFKVEVEMPGMSEEDITLSVQKGKLMIRGSKTASKQNEGKEYFSREISYGEYERSIDLPDYVDASQAKASMNKGMLWIEMPKQQGALQDSQEIAIERGSEEKSNPKIGEKANQSEEKLNKLETKPTKVEEKFNKPEDKSNKTEEKPNKKE